MPKAPSFLVRGAVSLLLAGGSSGCSFIFVKTPPAAPSTEGRVTSRVSPPDCTSSRLAPGFDTAFGALQLVRTGLAATASDSVYDNPKAPLSRGADVALGVSFMTLFVSSAIYGFVHTSRCSRLKSGDDYDRPSAPETPETWSASTGEPRRAPPASPPQQSETAPAESAPPTPELAEEPVSDPETPPEKDSELGTAE